MANAISVDAEYGHATIISTNNCRMLLSIIGRGELRNLYDFYYGKKTSKEHLSPPFQFGSFRYMIFIGDESGPLKLRYRINENHSVILPETESYNPGETGFMDQKSKYGIIIFCREDRDQIGKIIEHYQTIQERDKCIVHGDCKDDEFFMTINKVIPGTR